ncbi:MAG: MFS transporter [Spirochaetales bacterium]|nr:MFS transporter [Spirochaetales bacterium]
MKKLSLPVKLAYASGGLALNFANLLISQWLLRLYAPTLSGALVPPVLFSIIFLVGRVVDGVTDPLVGYLSDTFRSRRGRRKPFILFALLPTALVSALMWFPPHPGGGHWVNGVFIFVLVQLFFIFWTILANPYMSMIPQLTSDPKERIDITTLQAVFLMVGTALSAVIGNIKEAAGWGGLGVTVGVITVISFVPTLLFVQEGGTEENGGSAAAAGGYDGEAQPKFSITGMGSWIATTFRNKPFVLLLAATSLFWFSLNTMILLIPFWVEHVAGKTDAQVIFVMVPYILANVIAFVPFNAASKRWGKRPVFLFTLAVSGLASVSLVFVGTGGLDSFLHTQIVMGLYGVSTSGFLMLPNALLADVVDFDAERTGQRREAIHFGVQSFFQKVSIGLSIVVSSTLMFAGGSDLPTILGLKLVASSSGIFALVAAGVFIGYRLKEQPAGQ